MDESVALREIAYPDEDTLSRGVSFLYLPADTNQLMDSLWLDVKAEGAGGMTGILIALAAVVLVIAAFFVIRTSRTKKRKANRGKTS
jgi:hypothetical protein